MADIGRRIVWWAVVVAAIMWWSPPGEALAADFGVNATLDADDAAPGNGLCATITAGQCTLRAAIREANALGGGPHNITLPPAVYTLTRTGTDDTAVNGDLDITATITINGIFAPANFIQACDEGANPACTGIDRVFDVQEGGSLTINGVTIRNGSAVDPAFGGGIRVNDRGAVTLSNSVLAENQSTLHGGGLSVTGPAGTATLTNVTLRNNHAENAGGAIVNIGGQLTLTNVTISGNTAGAVGGLVQLGSPSASATLNNVTVASNTTSSSFAGGLFSEVGTFTLRNSIVAGNTNPDGSSNCGTRFSAVFSSEGFNLVSPGTGCGLSAATNDLIDVNPKLGPLQANGVPVPTHALPPSSPAIDAANPAAPGGGGAACAFADARAIIRTADGNLDGTGRCDIGAYELASFTVNSTSDLDDATPGDGICATGTPRRCTPRAAIREANAIGGAAVSLPSGFFSLTRTGADNTAENGDLDVTAALLIAGSGPATTFVQACGVDVNPRCIGIDRVFHVLAGGSLTLSGVAVRKGNATSGGGGILSQGILSLTNVLLDGNDGGQQGGGLSNGVGAVATLSNVSIANNRAVQGGGIANFSEVLSLNNVTINDNVASAENGGGLLQAGNQAPGALLASVTVAGNTASGSGGGLFVDTGEITMRNSIVANNTLVAGGSSNCAGGGIFSSQGFNLVFPGAGCGFATETNDRLNADPKLGPLADNAGQTPTIALLPGSAAIDAGNPGTPGSGGAACPAADQRGQARVDGNADGAVRCDIGAFELVPVPIDLAVTLTDGVSAPPPGANLTYTLTVTNPGGVTVPNIQVAGTFPPPLTNVTWGCQAIVGSSVAPCNGSGNLVSSLRLPAGGSVTYTVQATVPAGTALGTQIAATAAITPPAGVADPNGANNGATDTDTVTAPACSPRPRVVVQVAPNGAGRLHVTLTPSTNPGQAANQIQAVRLGTLQNAAVDVPVQPGVPAAQNGLTSGAQVGLTGPVASLNLVVRRVPPPGITTPVAFTAPMTVTDGCGAWPTLAGGGTGVP